jgi:transcriptional regulator with XRE-family HTH domain
MNIPVIVDVAIGLIFIYLILSLLASEILELIATVLQWRAKHLREAIINLLAGDTITDQNIEAAKRLTKDLYNHPLLNDLNQEARGLFATLFRKITWVFSWFYQWLTGGERVFGNKVTAPSYIPGETFATALIERLGIAKLVEPLIDAKFNRFRDSIIEKIGIIIGCSKNDIMKLEDLKKKTSEDYQKEPDYKVLQCDLYNICKQFSEHKLTLIAAIDKMSLEIDRFINQLKNDDPNKLNEQKKKLDLWKRGLFGKQNELALVNGGLKPTLEEVADLVNLSSGTYQVFENEFRTYSQNRQKQFAEELLNFLLVFELSITIITSPKENFENFNEQEIIALIRKIIDSMQSEDKEIWDAVSTPPKTGISLSEVGIKLIENRLKKQVNLEALKAFKEGFGEQGQELLGSKTKIFRKEQIRTGFFLISLLVFLLLAVFTLGDFLITPLGGIFFVIALVVLFIGFIGFCNIKPNPSNLSNTVDGFFSSICNISIYNIEKDLSQKMLIKDPIKTSIKNFIKDFGKEIKSLENDKSLLKWELSRLGQSFRQYYRALVVNNADVDLPFLPRSVKQSVASLVRRTKTKIDRTGNEVDQLREEVEIWFDRSMDRSSGVYKRNATGVTILIGFLLAVVTNSDSIYIVNRLAYDQELRQTTVKGAERFLAPENQPSPSASPTRGNRVDSVTGDRPENQPSPSASPTPVDENELRNLNRRASQVLEEQLALPIGWNPRVLGRQLDCELPENARDDWKKLFDKCISPDRKDGIIIDRVLEKPKVYFIPTAILAMIFTLGKWQVGLLFLLGWFLTAIAISMGATFWFELLGKLVSVRNTGNRPPSSANQTSVNSEKTSE